MSNLKFASSMLGGSLVAAMVIAFTLLWLTKDVNKGDVEIIGYGVTSEFQEEVGATWVPIAVDDTGGATWHIPLTCDVAPVRIIDGDSDSINLFWCNIDSWLKST